MHATRELCRAVAHGGTQTSRDRDVIAEDAKWRKCDSCHALLKTFQEGPYIFKKNKTTLRTTHVHMHAWTRTCTNLCVRVRAHACAHTLLVHTRAHKTGKRNLVYAETKMNKQSSRSHAVLQVSPCLRSLLVCEYLGSSPSVFACMHHGRTPMYVHAHVCMCMKIRIRWRRRAIEGKEQYVDQHCQVHRMHSSTRACMHVRVRAQACMHDCGRMHMRTHAHAQDGASSGMVYTTETTAVVQIACAGAYVRTLVRTRARARARTHVHTRTRTYTNSCLSWTWLALSG